MDQEKAHTIFIVDDMKENIDVLLGALENDYDVRAALNGEDALVDIPRHLPDLILLDLVLPGIDGYEVCRRLKQNPATSHIPVIFLTAIADPLSEKKGLEAGAVDYISKPILSPIVRARVSVHLALKQAREELANQNDILERKVTERTRELTAKTVELKKTLKEKEVLLKEVHHRVKNNLQYMSSLLSLQFAEIEDSSISEMLKSYQGRIESIALIHQEMYDADNFIDVDLVSFVKKLVSRICGANELKFDNDRLNINLKDFVIDINSAIPCAQILNELFVFLLTCPITASKEISVSFNLNKEGVFIMKVGIPKMENPKFCMETFNHSFGMQIIDILIEQLKGVLETSAGEGLFYKISFNDPGLKTYQRIDKNGAMYA